MNTADRTSPIPTALIGFGFSARVFHLPFVQALPDFRLTAVSTSRDDNLHLIDERVSRYRDAQTLLAEDEARLVIITTPNDSHYTLARQALERGKDVIVDKPFVCSSKEGQALIDLAKERNRLLSVYQNRRWDGDFLTLKSLIASGRLGQVRLLESRFDRFRPEPRERWREQPGRGSGIWFDLGPHLLDQALQLFGSPQAITARLACLREQCEVTDYFHVQLHYPQLEVVLNSSPYCASANLRFQVEGSGGSYRKQGLDPQEARLLAGVRPDRDEWAKETPEQWGQFSDAQDSEVMETLCGGYQHYYQAVADTLLRGGDNPVPAEQALEAIRLIELAQQSNDEGRRIKL
ncbi:oxidoreductase [Marinobacterium zhoushanense]|uniref:Oxidoreductase n=1 Tax=Marinobacterium zhoushanense TaxID=1679163 RepID=A0ABQ1KAQ0_9GAMM|nr:oxidoreductase [Marinobacterium zhoushanense]GGB93945.1 oxidoreductase [Marinobacterium zhoushanense]